MRFVWLLLLVACSDKSEPSPPPTEPKPPDDNYLKEVDAALKTFVDKVKPIVAMPTEPCKTQKQTGTAMTRATATLDGLIALADGKPLPPSGNVASFMVIQEIAHHRDGTKPLSRNRAQAIVEQLGKNRPYLIYDVTSYDAAGKFEARVVSIDLKAGKPICTFPLKLDAKLEPDQTMSKLVRAQLESALYDLDP